MTPGWHVGKANGVTYLLKEGGGGGCHSEMRLNPNNGMASVVMVNGIEFNPTRFPNRLDGAFLP